MDTVNREPILFGDYRNALTEDPRLYEDIVDYEAAKAIFDEVSNLLFSSTPLSLSHVPIIFSCISYVVDCVNQTRFSKRF